jgi:hypothetical protein
MRESGKKGKSLMTVTQSPMTATQGEAVMADAFELRLPDVELWTLDSFAFASFAYS